MLERLGKLANKFFSAVGKEEQALEELHQESKATIDRFEARDPGLKQLLNSAHGYVVFPSVGKASAVLGGAFGKGEVFERGEMIGYAAVAQLTVGVQLGGDTFGEVIAFQDKAALDRFKAGKWAFAASASAVLVKAGAAASARYERGVAVFVLPEGGMMLELAIGAQRFFYRAAFLGRAKSVRRAVTKSSSSSSSSSSSQPKRAARKKKPTRAQRGKKTRREAGAKTRTNRRTQKRPRAQTRRRAAGRR
jgi:hypothetical protein